MKNNTCVHAMNRICFSSEDVFRKQLFAKIEWEKAGHTFDQETQEGLWPDVKEGFTAILKAGQHREKETVQKAASAAETTGEKKVMQRATDAAESAGEKKVMQKATGAAESAEEKKVMQRAAGAAETTGEKEMTRSASWWSGHGRRKLAAAAVILLVVIAGIAQSGKVYSHIAKYLTYVMQHMTMNYEKNMGKYSQTTDWVVRNGSTQINVQEIAVTNHSILLKVKAEDDTSAGSKENGSSAEASGSDMMQKLSTTGLQGTWRDGKEFDYLVPSTVLHSEGQDEYIIMYGIGEDILQDASVTDAKELTGHTLTLALDMEAWSESDDAAVSDTTSIQIKKAYEEKEITVNQDLAFNLHGAAQHFAVRTMTFNGVFWYIQYDICVDTNSKGSVIEPAEQEYLDENGNGELYQPVAYHDGKEYKLMEATSAAQFESDNTNSHLLCIAADEELDQIALYVRKYTLKNYRSNRGTLQNSITIKTN